METTPGIIEKILNQFIDRPDTDLALSYWLCRTADEFNMREGQIEF